MKGVTKGFVVCIAAGLLATGCAAKKSSPFIKHGEPKRKIPVADPASQQDSLERAIAKTREVTKHAQPPPRPKVKTAETEDATLAGALQDLHLGPTAPRHLAVAHAYRRLGILDLALDHYQSARRLNPSSPAAYDGMARVWRDWHQPEFALGDVHRALYYAPRSPEVLNTLGTILQALGKLQEAEAAYAKAVALAPAAGYAFNNLCYAAILASDPEAVATCRRALAASPGLRATANNLALALGLTGELGLAREEFAQTGTAAETAYNMGMVYMARREFKEADKAFRQATMLNPRARAAWQRLEQVRAATAASTTPSPPEARSPKAGARSLDPEP